MSVYTAQIVTATSYVRAVAETPRSFLPEEIPATMTFVELQNGSAARPGQYYVNGKFQDAAP